MTSACNISRLSGPNWLLSAWLLFAPSIAGAQEACAIIRAGGAGDWPPVSYLDPQSQETKGYAYGLIGRLSREYDKPFRYYINIPWPRMMFMAANNKIDLIAGLIPSPERSEHLVFSEPFHHINLYAFVAKNRDLNIEKVEDLANYWRVEGYGSFKGHRIEELAKDKTVRVKNDRLFADMLHHKRGDYYVSSIRSQKKWLSHFPRFKEMKRLPFVVETLNVSIGISRNTPCKNLLRDINTLVRSFKASKEETSSSPP
ncbi:transporter substrate-binding domain-containing protein [Thalassomonas sp. RHCl1]|uniref:substrate-binding periplasmic protein n=1 Tax=Thalassomonas sp. RHCl1 TaxID=2995320 RepID=UPI00248B214E|nr:transporter substrate-binding domain-containing protein [Thalassomonas sp. RHCl1]